MALRTRLTTARELVVRAVKRRVAIDARSLAAFRIALGLLLLADLALRARNLEAFYTDGGVLPRTALLAHGNPLHLSLHVVSGEAWVQWLLFLLAGAFAAALTVGYRTRAATVGSWLLLVSLHNRLGNVLNGGDFQLRLLLFWAMFLPLGARWAVDSYHARQHRDGAAPTGASGPDGLDASRPRGSESACPGASRPDRSRASVTSVASAALLIQVVLVYATNAAFKLSGDVWLRGEGLQYVFSLGQFTILLGDHLGAYPGLLRVLGHLWLATIACSFLLIALTGRARTALVLLFVGMHLGMALTMRIDLFPLISVAGLLPFFPAWFWDRVRPWARRYAPASTCGAWLRTLAVGLPVVTVSGVPRALRRASGAVTTGVPIVFLVLVVLFNVQVLGYTEVAGREVLSEEAEAAIDLTRTDQYWNMFAPDPLSTDGWVVAPGQLANGSRVDAFHGGPVRWERPPDISDSYPTARWRKYLVRLWRYDTADRERFAAYLCRRWNARHDTALEQVAVYFVEQPTRIDAAEEPTRRVRLSGRQC